MPSEVLMNKRNETVREIRICEECGEKSSVLGWHDTSFAYLHAGKEIQLTARVPAWECAACGDAYSDSSAEEIRHEVVCRYLGRLTPDDIVELRNGRGLTQVQLAELTGLGVASIRRWELGNQIQTESVDRALRLLFADDHTYRVAVSIAERDYAPVGDPTFVTALSQQARNEAKVFHLRKKVA